MIELFGGRVVGVLPQHHADTRGVLSVYDFGRHGFSAVRSFIVDAPDGTIRGRHGHRLCRQVWIRLAGEIELELRHGGAVERLVLNTDAPAVLVEPLVWGQQVYRGGARLLVHCDQPYDPADLLTGPL